MNPQIRETLEWLKQQGLPPLPIAPAQDPERFPARNQDGSLKVGQNGLPLPAFTGKNPSFLDPWGMPHLIRHTRYQDRLPSAYELDTWFSNPANGIGTLGGWRGLVWIDVDVKQFESQAACDSRIAQWLNHYPLLRQTFTERTHSGGWRFAVRVHEKTFTNFSLDGAGGRHMGEALGQGRFTVLAPTIGPSGNAYVNLNRAPPVWVERLDAIGLYPVSRRRERAASSHVRSHSHPRPAQPGVLRIEDLATAKAQSILHGESPLESRSHSLTYALREFYGWENWAAQNKVPISGDAEDLARQVGEALEIDGDRVQRIIQSLPDPANCIPAVVFTGGEVSAWRQVGKINQEVYRDFCPAEVQQEIKAHAAIRFNQVRQNLLRAKQSQYLVGRPHKRENVVATTPERSLLPTREREFLRYAWDIVTRLGQVRSKDSAARLGQPNYLFQDRVYRLEANENYLTVRTQDRGLIFSAQNGEVQLSKLTWEDYQRFQAISAEVDQRLTSRSPVLSQSPVLE